MEWKVCFTKVTGKEAVRTEGLRKKILVAGLLFTVLFPLSSQAASLQEIRKAAGTGEARAQYELAIRRLSGDGLKKDIESAIGWLQLSAEQDYALAQYKLGMLYREGRQVGQDMDQAIEYLTMAAEQGSAPAQYLLGDIYLQGEGVAKDLDEAKEWLELSAGHGYKKAEQALKQLLSPEEIEDARREKEESSARAAMLALSPYEQGMKYLRGDGVSRSHKQAAKWFQQAAEQGDANSQYQLGELLRKGRGVKRNKKLANKWYAAAAKQGHIKAINRLGGCGFC